MGNNVSLENVLIGEARAFVETVRSLLAPRELAGSQSSPTDRHVDETGSNSLRPSAAMLDYVLNQLERLTMLKERGALSDEEFQAQKQSILKAH